MKKSKNSRVVPRLLAGENAWACAGDEKSWKRCTFVKRRAEV